MLLAAAVAAAAVVVVVAAAAAAPVVLLSNRAACRPMWLAIVRCSAMCCDISRSSAARVCSQQSPRGASEAPKLSP